MEKGFIYAVLMAVGVFMIIFGPNTMLWEVVGVLFSSYGCYQCGRFDAFDEIRQTREGN